MKVLVAEDDRFLMKLYEAKLAEANYDFITALNGVEAIDKIKAEKPDMVLLDVMMPQKNGFDVLAEMKADPELKDIPVVILSNLGQDGDVKKGLEMGAVDYIVKSNISIEDVISKVEKYGSTKAAEAQAETSTENPPAQAGLDNAIHDVPPPTPEDAAKNSVVLCGGCGEKVEAGTNFCPKCGKKIE